MTNTWTILSDDDGNSQTIKYTV